MRYVSYAVDDTGARRDLAAMPASARLVGWQCGVEPLFVAVWSYLPGVTLEADEAEAIASDFLAEREWFADNANPPAADYII